MIQIENIESGKMIQKNINTRIMIRNTKKTRKMIQIQHNNKITRNYDTKYKIQKMLISEK